MSIEHDKLAEDPVSKTQYANDTEKEGAFTSATRVPTTASGIVTVEELKEGDEALSLIKELGYTPHTFQQSLAGKFDEAYYRKLTWKIDLYILPFLAFTYFLQFLDKNLLNYAAVMGLRDDTHLVGNQYNNIAAAFYYGFLVFELPTTWLAQKSGKIATYLGVNLILWGILLGCTAACTSYGPLFAVRFLLGAFEACVAPILILLISMFYPKYSQAKRVAVFYCMNGLTEILGGAIAYGIAGVNTKFANWRILYVLFGGITVVHGFLVLAYLPNSPVRALRFTKEEKVAILLRVKHNQSGTQNRKWKLYQAVEAFTDPKLILVYLMVLLTSVSNGGLSNFTSLIIKGFGYSSRRSLILQSPRGAVAFICSILSGILSDRIRDRSSIVAMCCILPVIGGAILVAATHPRGLLLAAVYMTGSFGISFQALLAWNASNTAGYTKKVVISAMTMICFALGNIIGTYTYPASDAPQYLPGKAAFMSCLAVAFVLSGVLRFTNVFYNKRKAKALAEMDPATIETKSDEMAFADESDMRNPFFKYTY